MKLKSTLFLLSSTFISIFSYAQTIQENDYTLNYVDNKVQINFNKGVTLKAFDNKSQIQKRIAQVSNSNSFVLDSLQPAQIIKLEY